MSRAADTLAERLNLFNEVCGSCQYGTFPNREPDPIGFEKYDGQVRNCMHNAYIVAAVALSAEGLQKVFRAAGDQ